jgi:hypothetical protein
MKVLHRRQFWRPALLRCRASRALQGRKLIRRGRSLWWWHSRREGRSGDTIMRIVANHMRRTLGQTIVIDKVGGAAGSIGIGRVARGVPDGYMLSYGNWAPTPAARL